MPGCQGQVLYSGGKWEEAEMLGKKEKTNGAFT